MGLKGGAFPHDKGGEFYNYGKEYFDLVFSLTPISEQQKPAET